MSSSLVATRVALLMLLALLAALLLAAASNGTSQVVLAGNPIDQVREALRCDLVPERPGCSA